MPIGRFVGIGVARYAAPQLRELPHAVSDVEAVRGVLGEAFDGQPLCDPTEQQARAYLKAVKDSVGDDGALVAMWSGHGLRTRGAGMRLLCSDSDRDEASGLDAPTVASHCALSGAGQILLIIDTCFSGGGIPDATQVAASLVATHPPDAERVWVGVLASCSDRDTAVDGRLGALLCRLLDPGRGPRDPHVRRRWSVHNVRLRGDDLCDAVLKEWEDTDRVPRFRSDGNAWWMLTNPLYRAGAPRQVVEHLLQTARGGGALLDERSWFTGRTDEVDTVVGWVREARPGVFVVTGSAGIGKSAVVGRVVSLADPTERERLLRGGRTWDHTDPEPGAVRAHAHARALTVDRLADLLDEHLCSDGYLERADAPRNAAELLGAVQRTVVEGGKPTPVLVVDGLDEARSESFTIAQDLLVRLGRWATVIVSTRPTPGKDATLVEALDPVAVLDLDAPEVQEASRVALRDYVAARLADTGAPEMNPALVAEHAVGSTGAADRPFLLARVITDQLREQPVDTSVPGWERRVATSIETAFEIDLKRVKPCSHRELPDELSPYQFGRTLLVALTWAFGAGFPEDEWCTVATALTGVAVGAADVAWVLDELGRYVVQDGEEGFAVYRVAHQSLADHLRPAFDSSAATMFDPAAEAVTNALLGRYRALLGSGVPARAPEYLWRYVWRHAAQLGPGGVEALGELAVGDSDLNLDVALASGELAARLRFWGRRAAALVPAERSAAIYRSLAADNPAHLPDLATSLNNLGIHYGELGRRADALPPTQQAVDTYRALAADNPAHLPDLATSLNNLGICYSELDRRADALPPTQQAVDTYRALAADNPAHLPDLATSLNNLGIRYSELGRRADALPPTQEAVELRRALAADNPAFLPDLAGALTNLGIRHSELGRRGEALPPTQQAVDSYRALAADNAAFLPDLAGALTILGICYRELGRPGEALPPTQESVDSYRALAADNPAFIPNLATSLINLGTYYGWLGRPTEALPPTQEAVDTYRALATDNPAHLPDLAGALSNLGVCYGDLGRPGEALPPTQESVDTYRALAADNPAFLPDLAMSLSNLGIRYNQLGRPGEAQRPAKEAVELCRALAADNPAFLPDLAGALTNLGNRYSELDRPGEALPPTQQAVDTYRALAADNPAFLPNLATSLNNLGNGYSQLGRPGEALPPTQQAVDTYRAVAADDPAFLPDLAMSLINLGNRYSELDRSADALPPTQQAVDTYRALAVDNPAFLPDLAGALSNLGVCYGELGRPTEALPPTQESVDTYRALAADSPAHLPDLAGALSNLGVYYRELGRIDDIDRAWDAAMYGLGHPASAALLVYRSRYAEGGNPEAAAWLAAALTLAEDDRAVVAGVHDEARHHDDAAAPAWRAAWTAATGQPAPAWLLVDRDLLTHAAAWRATPTYDEEYRYLAENPQLLDLAADLAIEEALLDASEPEAARYRDLRAVARRDDVEAAYHSLLLDALADEFTHADPATQRRLLDTRRTDLLDDRVRTTLDARAADDDATAADVHAADVLAVLAAGASDSLVDEVYAAAEQPDRFPELLRTTAAGPSSGVTLEALAQIALDTATSNSEAAVAFLYAALATDDRDEAQTRLQQALHYDPDHRTEWSRLLLALRTARPIALDLLDILLAAPSEE